MKNNGRNKTQTVNIDLEQLTWLVCSNCSCPVFVRVFNAGVIPMLVSPTGKEEAINYDDGACENCGTLAHNCTKVDFTTYNQLTKLYLEHKQKMAVMFNDFRKDNRPS